MENKEYEFKYNAETIKLEDFHKTCKILNPIEIKEVSSWDVYYTDKQNNFIRYRNSLSKPELTIKRKINENNNQDRIEVNIQLKDNKESTILAFTDLLGYKENFRIYKNCCIYYYDNVDIVYYIVYNENMKEIGRFLEIEFLEDKAADPKLVFDILKDYEYSISNLGILPQNRLKKSLFEMYRKGD
jgi:adenylate cyclase class IV